MHLYPENEKKNGQLKSLKPERKYEFFACICLKPCCISSENSRQAVIPRRRFKPAAIISLEART